uniref:uncharacterized protein LOC122601317 n=1 Tax=Erigeron canadensis TaxID=72917 RepID=UPI001CB8D90C|nr:uncharacterized protein LOC122601317 [Erigeron canadensis]
MVISQSDQVVHTQVYVKSDKRTVFCSFVYVHNYYIDRRVLWHDLIRHKVFVQDKPWVLLGDFNAALFLVDKDVGSSRIDTTMRDFKECVDEIEVTDVNRIGAHALFQPYRTSDHAPVVLCFPLVSKFKPKPFKFANVLVHHDNFKQVVMELWSNEVQGYHMFKVVKKLKALKQPLRKLLFSKGNLHSKVENLRFELDEVQKAIDRDPSNHDLRDEDAAYLKAYNDVFLDEQWFLKQKAKVNWLRVGDSNLAYFHKVVKARKARNRIDSVIDSSGNRVDGDAVGPAFVAHYKMFLGTPGIVSRLNSNGLFCKKLTNDKVSALGRPISNEEVKLAIFEMGDDKALGPDGFFAAFFKNSWDIVGPNVIDALKDFFLSGRLLKEIIANQINDCLHKLVGSNPSALIPGRSISDNILLTQELLHNYHLDRGTPRCAFKVDIQKAYDMVDWRFLKRILIEFGFNSTMVHWIITCVATTSFSLCINGSLHGFFSGKRGLRQVDPLSPYLFTLVMEVLTLMLKRRIRESGGFTFHPKCDGLDIINLCFADDQ